MPLALASAVQAYCISVKTKSCVDQNKQEPTRSRMSSHIRGPKLGAPVQQELQEIHKDLVAPDFIPCLVPSVPGSGTRR